MEFLIAILALALLVVVILVVSAPLRAAWSSQDDVVVGRAALGEAQGEPPKERADPDRARWAGRAVGESVSDRAAEDAPSSRPRVRRSTARFATPSSTTARGSSRKRTSPPPTVRLRAEAVEILDRLAALDGRRIRPRDA